MFRLKIITLLTLVTYSLFTSARTYDSIESRSVKRQKRKTEYVEEGDEYRCVKNVYKLHQVDAAVAAACDYVNSGKKTWGFTRWPKSYRPKDKSQFPFVSNTLRLWPILANGEIFEGRFRSPGNNFVVIDGSCQLAGVVALFKSDPVFRGPCPIIGCYGRPYKEYKNCELVEAVGRHPLKSKDDEENQENDEDAEEEEGEEEEEEVEQDEK
ncbi:putative secreted effector protein [Golovinomyces cichoracearum]|uniref:Putative secreted effector protein n=1 Tax=Golovinomyces cichoracearum TaxID=62708 RepID=A0A420J2R6_9PEZI|nr:putative secreted effector protein [Golovinomyces cichoracearum]